MFVEQKINNLSPDELEKQTNTYCLVTKTDHVLLMFDKRGLDIKIRVYVIVYSNTYFLGDPVYFRVYLSHE